MRLFGKSLLATASMLLTNYSCLDPKQEELPNYVKTKQFNANNPIQDRINVCRMKRYKGIVISVFDGHGGDLCAEYVAGNIERCLNQSLTRNFKTFDMKVHEKMAVVLEECYDELENGFKAVFQQNIEDINYQRVGACALTAILTPQFAIFANSGDCQGAFLGGRKTIKTNERLNAGEPQEQKRLKQAFPTQPDIFSCIPGTNYCYVKGRLQPTRSFGDFYLKSPEYNFTNIRKFTGPYITHKPKITVFPYSRGIGSTLVIATDGLWDELDELQMETLLEGEHKSGRAADILFDAAIKKILKRNRIKDFQRLQQIPNRRKLHDDISLVTVDMEEFMNSFRRFR